jgi:hypothetical protein
MADYNTAFGPAASGRGIKKYNKAVSIAFWLLLELQKTKHIDAMHKVVQNLNSRDPLCKLHPLQG